jgi:signal transduction histidine kinase
MTAIAPKEIRVLLVDRNEDEFVLLKDELSRIPGTLFLVDWCDDVEEARAALLANRHDVYLIDFNLEGASGIQLITDARKDGFEGPCIILSVPGDDRVDLMAMRSGAQDYLDKHSLHAGPLERAIFFAVERQRLHREHQAFQRRIQETQRLESLGLLAGGLAHDFNNLLGCVLGSIEMARLHDRSPAKREENLGVAIHAVEQATVLCTQMLAYSGRGVRRISAVDLPGFTGRVLDVLVSSIPPEVRIVRELDKTPPVDADAAQLQQILMNLVTNARDAIAGAGIITVRTGLASKAGPTRFKGFRLRPDSQDREDYAWLQVQDTGCGMDGATLERIFDPFFTTKQNGHGLGMAAVMGIIKSHGGALDVDSRPGQGTTFTVYFPAGAAAVPLANSRPAPDEASQSHPGGTVLFVDDNLSLLNIARSTMEYAGIGVLTAEGGAAALEVFGREGSRIQVAVLDMTMPQMGGEELYRRLTALKPGLRVILSSGYHESEVMGSLVNAGKVEFLQKPYRPAALIQMVRKAMREDQPPAAGLRANVKASAAG